MIQNSQVKLFYYGQKYVLEIFQINYELEDDIGLDKAKQKHVVSCLWEDSLIDNHVPFL